MVTSKLIRCLSAENVRAAEVEYQPSETQRHRRAIYSSAGASAVLSSLSVVFSAGYGYHLKRNRAHQQNAPDSCMSEVHSVRLSRRSCMMRVESL
jgi:hypothetical protein